MLQIPGLERTVDSRSLFSIAHELRALLGAVTVEPDLGSEFYQEPVPGDAAPEGVLKDLFLGGCFVPGDPPADHRWALDRAGVLDAFDVSPARGAGIRIAQPDTGVTRHAELSDVTIADGFNVLAGTSDPTDPLSGGGNPGHGTGTASVAVSGPSGQVLGSAPAATLVPIRCVESVILTFDGGAVAKAIDHARVRGCHVVTMSLGGTPSRAMQRAIRQAIQSGMIVLAAAGNCVHFVVYPARYDEVIAVAGSNVNDGTWPGSCHGGAVDISAPGEKVWKAVAGPGGTSVGGGQGTSFAVAITAGVAALWLSHHGRPKVLAAANRRRMSVQALFREVLIESARVPVGWRTSEFGAGIVDAEALLSRTLEGPVAPAPEGVPGGAASETLGLLNDAFGPAEAARLAGVASQPQFQLELSSLVFEGARAGLRPADQVGAEAVLAGRRPARSWRRRSACWDRRVGRRPAFTPMRPSLRAERHPRPRPGRARRRPTQGARGSRRPDPGGRPRVAARRLRGAAGGARGAGCRRAGERRGDQAATP